MKFNKATSASVVMAAGLLSGCVSFEKHDPSDGRRGYDLLVPSQSKVIMGNRGVVPNPYEEPATFAIVNSGNTNDLSSGDLPNNDMLPDDAFNIDGTNTLEKEPPFKRPVDEVTPEISLPPKPKKLTYIVKKGDSLWKIGRMYGVSMGALANENNLPLNKALKIGKPLTIPAGGKLQPKEKWSTPKRSRKASSKGPSVKRSNGKRPSASAGSYKPKGKQPIPANGKYTVKNNDSLWKISHTYGVSINDIKKWNNLKSDRLDKGQVLVLKSGASSVVSNRKNYDLSRKKKQDKQRETVKTPPPVSDDNKKEKEPIVIGQNKNQDQTPKNGGAVANKDAGNKVQDTPKPPPAAEDKDIEYMDHTLGEFDKLEELAEVYVVTTEAIKKANPGIDWNKVTPGTIIRIPMESK